MKTILLNIAVVLAILNIAGCSNNANVPPSPEPAKANKISPTPRKSLTVAGLQMYTTTDINRNEPIILNAIKQASQSGVDFLLTPESALSGNWAGFDRKAVADAVERVAQAAKNAKVGLLLGTCYKEIENGKENCYNQVRVYTPQGQYLGYYAKILICSPLDAPGTGAMAVYKQGKLRTFDYQGLRFGVLICNDLHATPGFTTIPNPYLPWQLKKMGAQIIFLPLSSGSDQKYRGFHEESTKLWAIALKRYIVTVNALRSSDGMVNATGCVLDPNGNRVASIPDTGQQMFIYKIQLD